MAESSFSCLCWIFQFLSMKLSAISPELNCDLDLQDVRLQSSTQVDKENVFRLIFPQSLKLQILCTQDASSAFPGYNLQASNVHLNLYRASEEGFSHRIIPNPANVHVTRNAQLSAFPQVCIRRPWTASSAFLCRLIVVSTFYHGREELSGTRNFAALLQMLSLQIPLLVA